jgi:hypothetical protein
VLKTSALSEEAGRAACWEPRAKGAAAGIAVLGTQPGALEELAASSLALIGPLVIGGAEDFLRLCVSVAMPSLLRGPVPTKTRRLTKVGRLKGDLLRDKAADRKAEHIDLRQSVRCIAGDRSIRAEKSDSVVWETALPAFQAVAAEPPRASPAEFVSATGSIKLASLFLTLPTRTLTRLPASTSSPQPGRTQVGP